MGCYTFPLGGNFHNGEDFPLLILSILGVSYLGIILGTLFPLVLHLLLGKIPSGACPALRAAMLSEVPPSMVEITLLEHLNPMVVRTYGDCKVHVGLQ
jgi:hypothetical protein